MATTRKSLLMTAAAAAVLGLGLGPSGNAMAVAYSYAGIELQNFQIRVDPIGQGIAVQPSATRDTTTFARYDGYPVDNDPVTPPA